VVLTPASVQVPGSPVDMHLDWGLGRAEETNLERIPALVRDRAKVSVPAAGRMAVFRFEQSDFAIP